MPSKTAKQHRAMAAAAHGKGNIGIPAKVGAEFLSADKGKKFKKKGKRPAKHGGFNLP
jgi:hypothetical protein